MSNRNLRQRLKSAIQNPQTGDSDTRVSATLERMAHHEVNKRRNQSTTKSPWSMEVTKWMNGRPIVENGTLTLESGPYKAFIWDVGNERVVIRFENNHATEWTPSEKTLATLREELEWEIRQKAAKANAKTA